MAWGQSWFYYYPLKKFFSGALDHYELLESPHFFKHHLGDVVTSLIPENYFELHAQGEKCEIPWNIVAKMNNDFSKLMLALPGLARIVEHGARDKHIVVNVNTPKVHLVELFKDIIFDENHRSHALVETFHLEIYDSKYDNQDYKYFCGTYSVPKKEIAEIKHYRDLLAFRTI
jgi:hypothetical protein